MSRLVHKKVNGCSECPHWGGRGNLLVGCRRNPDFSFGANMEYWRTHIHRRCPLENYPIEVTSLRYICRDGNCVVSVLDVPAPVAQTVIVDGARLEVNCPGCRREMRLHTRNIDGPEDEVRAIAARIAFPEPRQNERLVESVNGERRPLLVADLQPIGVEHIQQPHSLLLFPRRDIYGNSEQWVEEIKRKLDGYSVPTIQAITCPPVHATIDGNLLSGWVRYIRDSQPYFIKRSNSVLSPALTDPDRHRAREMVTITYAPEEATSHKYAINSYLCRFLSHTEVVRSRIGHGLNVDRAGRSGDQRNGSPIPGWIKFDRAFSGGGNHVWYINLAVLHYLMSDGATRIDESTRRALEERPVNV